MSRLYTLTILRVRHILVVGLVLLAAFLPLAALPLAILTVTGLIVVAAEVAAFVITVPRSLSLVTLPDFRGPPSR